MASEVKRSNWRALMLIGLILLAILVLFYSCGRIPLGELVDIGRRWTVCEPICGTWTRKGDSMDWVGNWGNGATGQLTMTVNGRDVTVQRVDHAGVSKGLTATYTGKLTPAGKIENGRVEWRWHWGTNTTKTNTGTWTGTIDRSGK